MKKYQNLFGYIVSIPYLCGTNTKQILMNGLNTKSIIRLFKELETLNGLAQKKRCHILSDLTYNGHENPTLDHNGDFYVKIYLANFSRGDKRIIKSWYIYDHEPYLSEVDPRYNEPGKPWFDYLDDAIKEIKDYIKTL